MIFCYHLKTLSLIFCPLHCLFNFVINQLVTYTQVYILGIYSVLLIHIFLSRLCLDYLRHRIIISFGVSASSYVIILFQNCSSFYTACSFPYTFRNKLVQKDKNTFWGFDNNCANLQTILTMLSFPFHEHNISFHFLGFVLFFSSAYCNFQCTDTIHALFSFYSSMVHQL